MRPGWERKLEEAAESPLLPPLDWTRRDVDLPSLAGKTLVVTGVRGAGVSSALRQFLGLRQREGRARSSLLLVDLEDDRLPDPRVSDVEALLDVHARRHPEAPAAGRVLVIDGVTRLAGWEGFVEAQLRREPNLRVLVAGSSARLGEQLAPLGARVRLRPFSFREFLRRRWAEPTQPYRSLSGPEREDLHEHLLHYLREGGFPVVQGQLEAEARRRRRDLVDVLLLRDVIERHGVSNPESLRRLQRELLTHPTEGFSVQAFLRELKAGGRRVAKDTLHTQLDHLEDAGLIETLSLHTDSERRRRIHPRRIFPADCGLAADLAPSGRARDAALRTAVFHELRRRGYELGYLRLRDEKGEDHEVDFFARARGRDPLLVQVGTAEGGAEEAEAQREALRHARQLHPGARALRLVLESPASEELSDEARPASAWLLGEGGLAG